MPNLPTTIDGVLSTLDEIIEEHISDGNFLGIFAYVYRRTTAEIKQAILDGAFEDNPRMERFDVHFANFYIQAYWDFKAGKAASKAWELSFDNKDAPITIMQHLILGMNAHIHLDLGVAAATFPSGTSIESTKVDFMKVNDILKRLTNEMQGKISKVSPLLFVLDWLGKEKDEQVAGFSIVKARDFAWNNAVRLFNTKNENDRLIGIQELDQKVTAIGRIVAHPPGRILKWLVSFVRLFEEKDIGVLIGRLKAD